MLSFVIFVIAIFGTINQLFNCIIFITIIVVVFSFIGLTGYFRSVLFFKDGLVLLLFMLFACILAICLTPSIKYAIG